ncbi:MAG: nitrogenase component 1 [Acutalibacteraceae bacterium]
MKLPSDECTVADVANASAAKVNVVTNAIALPLAKKMQTRFGIPYIEFYNFCSPDAVYHAYKDLFNYLGKPFPKELEEKYQHALATVAEAKKTLDGKSFIYGNTTLPIFECIAFWSA